MCETISYSWGRDYCQELINIDGRPVPVSQTAANVLRRLRFENRTRVLWIDAICIDQLDGAAKSEQLAILSVIYRMSASNAIYLGEDFQDPAVIRRAVGHVVNDFRSKARGRSLQDVVMRKMADRGHWLTSRSGRELGDGIDTFALIDLFGSAWFSRLWVVQEALLAPRSTCHFGSESLPWQDVLTAAVWLTHNYSCIPKSLGDSHGLQSAYSIWRTHEMLLFDGMSLFDVFSFLHHTDLATEPKDNVFAMLSLSHPQTPKLQHELGLLRVDYTSSKTTEDVYRDPTRAIIEDRPRLYPCITPLD